MAKARQIVKRRRAVRNIRKITQTMQLIATARYQKTLQRATASKPYTQKIAEMVRTLAGQATVRHPLLERNDGVERTVLLVITSNRGLAGAYNANVLRQAAHTRRELQEQGRDVRLEIVGKKGLNYARFLGWTVDQRTTDVEDKIAFERVAEMAERYMRLYTERQIERVDVAYTRFESVGVQRAMVETLLPIEPPQATGDSGPRAEMEYSPEPATLLAHLLPETVKVRLYQIFNDAIVSEQIGRMVAMKAATDAAGDMIKFLTRQYNRARQTQITLELADIVGGAEAVK